MGELTSHLNINSQTLSSLNSRALKLGVSVEDLADKLLAQALSVSSSSQDTDIQLPVENPTALLEQKGTFSVSSHEIKGLEGKRFTDEGATAYTQAARYEFEKHASLKGLEVQKALAELPEIVAKHHGDFEFITKILVGKHVLSGEDMFLSIENMGFCPLQKTLQAWSGDPLIALGRAYVQAIEV